MPQSGKFHPHSMWKHENCMDAFFYVDRVRFDENGTHATLSGLWMVQGTAGFWAASDMTRLNIKPDQYKKWLPYTPKGEMRYV